MRPAATCGVGVSWSINREEDGRGVYFAASYHQDALVANLPGED